jgi:hypothetical protein
MLFELKYGFSVIEKVESGISKLGAENNKITPG